MWRYKNKLNRTKKWTRAWNEEIKEKRYRNGEVTSKREREQMRNIIGIRE